jgi:hypothetical protein
MAMDGAIGMGGDRTWGLGLRPLFPHAEREEYYGAEREEYYGAKRGGDYGAET